VMMGTCLGLCAIAWAVVSRYSTVAAVIMSVAALVIPPFAAIIANSSSATDRRRLPARPSSLPAKPQPARSPPTRPAPAGPYPPAGTAMSRTGVPVRALRATSLMAVTTSSGSLWWSM
jgi:hypothetical protein